MVNQKLHIPKTKIQIFNQMQQILEHDKTDHKLFPKPSFQVGGYI